MKDNNLLKNDYYLMGIDLGTTTLKVGVFNTEGEEIAFISKEYELIYPGDNMVENDVEKYWEEIISLIKKITLNLNRSKILALSISSQAETIVPINREGKPLRTAIVWLDGRSKKEAIQISSNFDNHDLFKITGQPFSDPTWPATKIKWIENNQKDIFEDTYKFLLLEDYIVLRFTGKIFGERSLYSSSYYFDINKLDYHDDMLEYLNISRRELPEIIATGTEVGKITDEISKWTGLSKNTMIIAGSIDQLAGAFGSGNIFEGSITETTGTALAIVLTINKPKIDFEHKIPCHIHAAEGKYCLLPYSTTGGMVLKWFKDNFYSLEEARSNDVSNIYNLMTKEAEKTGPGADGLIMLPHLLGALIPENNPRAKGVFFNIGIDHKKPHFTRAIMESIGFMIRNDLELFKKMGFQSNQITSLGGGAQSRLWNQIKADITGIKINTPSYTETAVRGAALIAGVGAGIYKDFNEASKLIEKDLETYYPDPKNREIYDMNFNKYKELYSRLESMF